MFNATKAATIAGYTAQSAHNAGSKILSLPAAQEYINELRAKAAMRNNITLDDIINQYARIAFFDPRTIYKEDGSLIRITDFDQTAATAMGSMDVEETSVDDELLSSKTKKFKPYDRIVALDRLRECLGWKEKERYRSIKRDAEGHVVETVEMETIQEDKIIFEDHTTPRTDGDL